MAKKINPLIVIGLVVIAFFLVSQIQQFALFTSSRTCENWLANEKSQGYIDASVSVTDTNFCWNKDGNQERLVSNLENSMGCKITYELSCEIPPVIIDTCDVLDTSTCSQRDDCVNGVNGCIPLSSAKCEDISGSDCLANGCNLLGDGSCVEQVCNPIISCTDWTVCDFYGQQDNNGPIKTRSKDCSDINGCSQDYTSVEVCSDNTVCVPNWACSSYGSCNNGVKSRTCVDVNNCGTDEGKPAISSSCVVSSVNTCDADTNTCSNGTVFNRTYENGCLLSQCSEETKDNFFTQKVEIFGASIPLWMLLTILGLIGLILFSGRRR